MLMARMTRLGISWCSSSSEGISSTHGPHHVAQKLSSTTRPGSWPDEWWSCVGDGEVRSRCRSVRVCTAIAASGEGQQRE